MGENLDIPGRYAVRTPMQWSAERNGGFSSAPPRRLARPVTHGAYGPEHVNVSDQRNDRESLFGFIGHLIRRYRQSPELGWADFELLEQPNHAVLAHVARKDEWAMVAVHNFSSDACTVELDLTSLVRDEHPPLDHLTDLLHGGTLEVTKNTLSVELDGYGYRWLRVVREGDLRIA